MKTFLLIISLVALTVSTVRAQTYTVKNTNSSGPDSLVEAIAQANAKNVNVIEILSELGTISLTEQMFVNANVTINGNGNTIDMGNNDRAFFIAGGVVNISNLTIQNGNATGGSAQDGGGGGAGLGGAIFVGSGSYATGNGSAAVAVGVVPTVTLTNMTFVNNQATGGTASAGPSGYGGGGGMGGAGADGYNGTIYSGGGGGGGFGNAASGGVSNTGGSGDGATGAFYWGTAMSSLSAGDGGWDLGGSTGGYGGANGGGGGGADAGTIGSGGGGGGVGGGDGIQGSGANGGFGGGGGASAGADGGSSGNGGFGGGGGGGGGGNGGFGGGGGTGGSGGFGGGNGGGSSGGGGMGAGGAVFVMAGATLNIVDSGFSQNAVNGGSGAVGGSAVGADLFLGANTTITVSEGNTQTMTDLGGGGNTNDNNIQNHTTDSNTQGGLAKAGAGTLVLNGTGNFYTGATVVNQGTLTLGPGATEIGTAAVVVGQNDGDVATLAFGSGAGLWLAGFAGTSGSDVAVVLGQQSGSTGTLQIGGGTGTNGAALGMRQITGGDGTAAVVFQQAANVDGSSTDYPFYTTLTGSLAVHQEGPGTTSLAPLYGPNTYTGGTFISGGSLNVGASGALPTDGSVTLSGGTLDNTGTNITLGDVLLQNGLIVGTGEITAASFTTESGVISSVLTGSGGLTQSGSGVTTLYAQNTYTGGTVVSAGTLRYGAADALPVAGAVTISGGALDLAGIDGQVGAVLLDGGSIINSSGPATLTASSYTTSSGTISAVLAGSGGLTQSGPGTTTVESVNTYAGPTTVTDGVLELGVASALPVSGRFAGDVVLSGGVLRLVAANGLASNTNLTLQGGTLDLNGYDNTPGLPDIMVMMDSGAIVDSQHSSAAIGVWELAALEGEISARMVIANTFIQNGPGTLLVSAPVTTANSYYAGTWIRGGTLAYGIDDALPTGAAVTVEAGATLDIAGHQATTYNAYLTSGQIVDSAGGGGLTVTTNMATQSGTISAVLTGSGGLVQDEVNNLVSSSVTTLTADNEYTGATVVNWGTLVQQGGSRTSGYTVNNGGTLNLAVSGATAAPSVVNTGGTLIISGNGNTVTADIAGGLMQVTGSGMKGSVVLAGDGQLALGASVALSSMSWEQGGTVILTLGGGAAVTTDTFSLMAGGAGGNIFAFTLAAGVQAGDTITLVTFDSMSGFTVEDFGFISTAGVDGSFELTAHTLNFTVAAVPEPSASVLLAIAGGLGLLWRISRRVKGAALAG